MSAPAPGDTITGLVAFEPGKLIRGVGKVLNVFTTKFFAQLRSPANGPRYNVYFEHAAEGVLWARGDLSSDESLLGAATLAFIVADVPALQSTDDTDMIPNHTIALVADPLNREYWLQPFDPSRHDDSSGEANVIDSVAGRQWIGR